MRAALLLICYLFVACNRPGAVSSLLNHYAKTDAAGVDSYLTYYAQGLKLNPASQVTGKMRAFFLAAMLVPDPKNNCSQWDCMLAGLTELKTKARSPLFSYALFHLADLAERQSQPAEALAFLELIPGLGSAEGALAPLERKASLLKGKLLQQTNSTAQAEHFESHAGRFSDAESLYFAAAALERAGQKDKALELALKVMDKPELDAPFSQSGLIIRNILNQRIYSLGDLHRRIRLMEALRIAKDKASALKLFDSLKNAQLSESEAVLFIHYGGRLMLDRGNAAAAANLILPRADVFLGEANEKAALDICERLLKKKQFGVAQSLFAVKPTSKSRLQCQLRLAQRSGKMDAHARQIAADYIRQFDPDSTLAERVFLRSCLPETKSRRGEISISCLEELRAVTQHLTIGAGARYYLAREYDRHGEAEKVKVLLTELATDYADDFYFFRLIEKPLRAQKGWADKPPAAGDRQGKILTALIHADLARAQDVGVHPQLKNLESEIKALGKDFDAPRQTALLLFAADSRDEARSLLRDDDKSKIYRQLIALGEIAGKDDISLFGVKQYLREKKIRPFLFEIPPYLRGLLYPKPYSSHVEKYAKKNGLDVPEVLALIRQESQFFPAALSVAHAQGLMQLLPSTAEIVAAKEGMESYNLFKPEDNIRLGTSFMRDIMDHYTADYVGLAIAYNAGPGRYTQWKKKYSSDDDIFIEEIPFQETYQYVRILLADRAKYRALMP